MHVYLIYIYIICKSVHVPGITKRTVFLYSRKSFRPKEKKTRLRKRAFFTVGNLIDTNQNQVETHSQQIPNLHTFTSYRSIAIQRCSKLQSMRILSKRCSKLQSMRILSETHLKLGGNHGAFFGKALSFLNPRLAVRDAQNLHHRTLLLARMAVAHRIVPRREDGSLQKRQEPCAMSSVIFFGGRKISLAGLGPERVYSASAFHCARSRS